MNRHNPSFQPLPGKRRHTSIYSHVVHLRDTENKTFTDIGKSMNRSRTSVIEIYKKAKRIDRSHFGQLKISSVRAINVLYNFFKSIGIDEPTLEDYRTFITLPVLKKLRNCGPETISEIYNSLIQAGVKPSWKWPEVIHTCPSCGQKILNNK